MTLEIFNTMQINKCQGCVLKRPLLITSRMISQQNEISLEGDFMGTSANI